MPRAAQARTISSGFTLIIHRSHGLPSSDLKTALIKNETVCDVSIDAPHTVFVRPQNLSLGGCNCTWHRNDGGETRNSTGLLDAALPLRALLAEAKRHARSRLG